MTTRGYAADGGGDGGRVLALGVQRDCAVGQGGDAAAAAGTATGTLTMGTRP